MPSLDMMNSREWGLTESWRTNSESVLRSKSTVNTPRILPASSKTGLAQVTPGTPWS
jgi:hypothetical protein